MSSGGELKCKIGPSVLNADLAELYNESQRLLDCGADYLHLDVMDGHFVPNLTFGHPWIEPMADAGVDQYTFHIEPCGTAGQPSVLDVCRKVQESGMKVGLALKPGTDVAAVEAFVDHCDMVLVMTVEPGFGGQSFMADMMPKVRRLRLRFPTLDIEVDGGVGPGTVDQCAQAGANMIVSGTAVVKAENPKRVICEMREAANGRLQSFHKHT